MKKYLDLLKSSPLFYAIKGNVLQSALDCLDARMSGFRKEDVIFLAGNPAKRVGIVLEGAVQVVRDDVFGNRTILAKLERGSLFGETFACAEVDTLPVSVIAVTDGFAMLLDYRKMIHGCGASASFHDQLAANMLNILAQKNLMLNQKIEIISARTIREKLMVYLNVQAAQKKSKRFAIPFNRQELADYLSVDRSALSREMSVMRKEGIFQYDKNWFELI